MTAHAPRRTGASHPRRWSAVCSKRSASAGSPPCIGTPSRRSTCSSGRGSRARPPACSPTTPTAGRTGFTHYFLHNRRLQIGGLVAESGEVTRQLLDDVLRTPEAELAGEVLCFAFPASTALEGALTRRRFDVTRYSYLQRALAPATAAAPSTAPAADRLAPAAVDRGRRRRHRAAVRARRTPAPRRPRPSRRAARSRSGPSTSRRSSRRPAAAASCRRPASRCSTRPTTGCAASC